MVLEKVLDRVRVYVVIPVFNRREHTLSCIRSLREQDYPNVDVVVVDSGSTDGTAEAIASLYPEVVVLPRDESFWWTAATNAGIEWVLERCGPDDFVLALNDDTTVAPDYVRTLVGVAQEHSPCLVGSVSVDSRSPDLIVDGGSSVNWWTAKSTRLNSGRCLADCVVEGTKLVEPTFLSGRGTLIPVKRFADGLFDSERLPHYGADFEFSQRAARDGYRLLVSYQAPVRSDVTATGILNKQSRVSWGEFGRMFFTIRSPACIKYRFRLARRFVPVWWLPVYVVLDTTRVVVGALRRQLSAAR